MPISAAGCGLSGLSGSRIGVVLQWDAFLVFEPRGGAAPFAGSIIARVG